MNYILDLVIITVIIGCVITGSRKGAVRMLITLAGYIVAVITAGLVSNAASDYVYEKAIKSTVISVLETEAESLGDEYLSKDRIGSLLRENGVDITDEQLELILENSGRYTELPENEKITESLNGVFKEYCEALANKLSGVVPEEILEEAERYLNEKDTDTKQLFDMLKSDKRSVIETIEREIIRPLMLRTVKTVLFAVTFAIVMIVVSIISHAAKIIREIPVVRSADSFLGVMLGFLQGLLYVVVINIGVSVFVKLTSDANEYLNSAVVAETYIFRFLYNATFYVLALILK